MKKEMNYYELADSWMNLNDDKPISYELIEDLIVFCFFYPVIATVMYAISHNPLIIYKGFILFIAVFAMTVIRKKFKHLSLFILLHVAVLILYFILAQGIMEKIAYTVFLIPYFYISFKKRLSQSRNYISLTSIILGEFLLGVLSITILFFKFAFIEKLIIVLSLVSLLTFMVYFHIIRANKLVDWEQKYTDKDSGSLNKFSRVFSLAVVVIISIFLLISYSLGFFKAAGNMDNGIVNYLTWLSANKVDPNYKPPTQKKTSDKSADAEMIAKIGRNNKPAPKLLMFFYNIMVYVIGIATILLIIFIIVLIIREFYRTFYDKIGNPNEKREFIFSLDETVEHTKESFRKLSKVISHPLDLSSRKKIRKMYQKKILSYKPKGISLDLNQSTGEIGNEIRTKTGSDLLPITNLYDAARYSKDDPTKEDLEKMKKLIHENKH